MNELKTFLPIETKMSFPTTDGKELALLRGTVRCFVDFTKVDRETVGRDSDMVACGLSVADQRGKVYRLERLIGANSFLELIRMSRNPPAQEMRVLIQGLRCYYDHSTCIPTAAWLGEETGFVALAYWGKHLDAVVDLLAYRFFDWDQLALRVHPLSYGAIGYQPAPEISVSVDWAAKIVLWPSLIGGERGPIGEQPTFRETDATAEAQDLVRVCP